MLASVNHTLIPVADYNLSATLNSGQAFRWQLRDGGWEGVVAGRWVRLRQVPEGIEAEAAPSLSPIGGEGQGEGALADWHWLTHYLQTKIVLSDILATFPDDPHLRAAVAGCRGLRLLRQEPWECLASFILSSTKQIVQIQQIVASLCERYGQPVAVPEGHAPAYAFPQPTNLALLAEGDLRACKMGFRAKYLQAAARRVVSGALDLAGVAKLSEDQARAELLRIPGVGPKIANCVLLFAYGFPRAFPVDVWVRRALREAYFPRRSPGKKRLEKFLSTHFGPHAGYAQQYLFHYMRSGEWGASGGSGPVNP